MQFLADTFGVQQLDDDTSAERLFGYDAVTDRGRRRPSAADVRSEDLMLNSQQRRQVSSDVHDLQRNFSLCAWAIRRHLDFVASFRFHARTPDEGFNRELESLMTQYQRPYHCDAAGNHPFPRLLRLTEAGRVVGGDCGLVGMADGSLVGIEGDRIRNPDNTATVAGEAENKRRWVHGVEVNGRGRRLRYGVHARQGNGFVFDRTVPASRFFFHGFFHRFDQIRGITPLTAAVDAMKDAYDIKEYARLKSKAAQIVTLAIYSDLQDTAGELYNTVPQTADVNGDGDEDDDEDQGDRYEIDFSNGPQKLELEQGDRAEIVQDKTPSTEMVNFLNVSMASAIKALDIPWNFWDEAHTNFFGSRAAWLLYDRSCQDKRADVLELLRKITIWLVQTWIRNEVLGNGLQLSLPSGWTMEDIKFEWVPVGVPWWKPQEELTTELQAVAAGVMDPYTVCKMHGFGDYEDNVRNTLRALKFAQDTATEMEVDWTPVFIPNVSPIQVTTSA